MARPWKPVMWVPSVELLPNVDRLSALTDSTGSAAINLDRDYEYRLIFDSPHGLWRLDTRRHVDGG